MNFRFLAEISSSAAGQNEATPPPGRGSGKLDSSMNSCEIGAAGHGSGAEASIRTESELRPAGIGSGSHSRSSRSYAASSSPLERIQINTVEGSSSLEESNLVNERSTEAQQARGAQDISMPASGKEKIEQHEQTCILMEKDSNILSLEQFRLITILMIFLKLYMFILYCLISP